jgi:hypothetical protein
MDVPRKITGVLQKISGVQPFITDVPQKITGYIPKIMWVLRILSGVLPLLMDVLPKRMEVVLFGWLLVACPLLLVADAGDGVPPWVRGDQPKVGGLAEPAVILSEVAISRDGR